jgi:hypothetical protein
VAAEDGVEAAHARGELEVDVHAVVRQQTTTCAPLARASSTTCCRFSSWMPKVQSGTK